MTWGLSDLHSLEGVWELTRTITHADGVENRLVGAATFHRDAEGLILDEEGTLTGAPEQPALTATRRYFWRMGSGAIEVFFDDGRPFHSIPLGVARPEATHDCPPDTYVVAYDFNDPTTWRARWQVNGPRKEYVMQSLYRYRHSATP